MLALLDARTSPIRSATAVAPDTAKTISLKRDRGGWVPWHRQHARVWFMSMDQLGGLQAADQYAGMLNAAIVN